jgi:hypothetical protein
MTAVNWLAFLSFWPPPVAKAALAAADEDDHCWFQGKRDGVSV